MNYIYCLSFIFLVSLAFGRISNKYSASDDGFSFRSSSSVGEVSSGASSDEDSLKWKRRHKKRKKSRRPQRGR